MSTIIVHFNEEDECWIEVVSGGGGAGAFNWTQGSEDTHNREIEKEIRGICDMKGWKIEIISTTNHKPPPPAEINKPPPRYQNPDDE